TPASITASRSGITTPVGLSPNSGAISASTSRMATGAQRRASFFFPMTVSSMLCTAGSAGHRHTRHELTAVTESGLLQNVRHMELHGALRDIEGTGDLAVVHSLRHQGDHFVLPCRQ